MGFSLNEKQYRKTCEECDKVLLAADSSLERVAIPWLHVLREHPVFLRQYESLFFPSSQLVKIMSFLRLFSLRVAFSLRLVWRILFSSEKFWYGGLPDGGPVDYIFLSHVLDASQLSAEDDFYFGEAPRELARRGKSVLIVLINHTSQTGDALEPSLRKSLIPRVVFSRVLSARRELVIRRQTLREARKLSCEASLTLDSLRRAVLWRASVEATGEGTKMCLRISRMVFEIVSRCKAKVILTTYEGHAWERVVFAAAREAKSNIYCIGYQHAALFRLQHSAKRSLGAGYDPDQILTAGPVGLRQLKSASGLSGVTLGVLGSSRSIKKIASQPNASSCLVLPEGLVEECRILLRFSLECAKANPDMHFIWRLHPIISFNNLLKKITALKSLPLNIEISQRTLVDDTSRSAWLLYRGSTAAISAAACGVVPIYLRQPGELSIDPLYEISDQHPEVETTEQFMSALQWIHWSDESRRYCDEFYSPINAAVLTQS